MLPSLILFVLHVVAPLSADLDALQNQKEALRLEYEHVIQAPGTFYCIIDLNAKTIALKADANLLRTCRILGQFGHQPTHTQRRYLKVQVPPYSPEPSSIARTRLLPLDFSERLTKGPKHRTQLYFEPSAIIQSIDLPIPPNTSGIQVNNQDMKALASALVPASLAIVLPQTSGKPTK